MGRDHGGTHILVSQEFLHRTDIVAVLQKMGGETVAQGVTAPTFWDAYALESLLHGSLPHRFRHMVSALNTSTRIDCAFGRGKDLLPDPGCTGMGVLTITGVRHGHLPVSCEAICFVEALHPGKMPLQGLCEQPGEHGDPVLGPLPIAHGEVVGGQIDLLHTPAHACHAAQASPRAQAGHQVGHTGAPGAPGVDCIAGTDCGEATRAFGPLTMLQVWQWLLDNSPGQKQERVARTMLCGSGHRLMGGQGGKTRPDRGGAPVLGMACSMQQQKAFDPADGGLCSTETAMREAEDLPHLVAQPGLRRHETSQRFSGLP